MRLYFDTTIYKLLNPDRGSVTEHRSSAESLKGNAVFIFSGAHLKEINKSKKEFQHGDLDILTEFAKRNYLCRSQTLQETEGLSLTPFEAIVNLDDEPLQNQDSNKFSLKYMLSELGIQVGYPDLDASESKDFTNCVSNYIQSEDRFFEKWVPQLQDFLAKEISGQSYLDKLKNTMSGFEKLDTYMQVHYAFETLDFFNTISHQVKQEKITVGSSDVEHCYFSTYCDYFITDNKETQVKAFVIFQLLEIPTKVLSSADFFFTRKDNLLHVETMQTFTQALEFDFKNNLKKIMTTKDRTAISIFKTNRNYFNVFDILEIHESDNGFHTYFLKTKRKKSFTALVAADIELVIKNMMQFLGMDDQQRGLYNFGEFTGINSVLRIWTIDTMRIKFAAYRENDVDTLCIIYYFLTGDSTSDSIEKRAL
ncbi:MAG TPA: hypothetical protein VFE57_04810 [Cyclobacteriaceae bacterium]|jgi:hypothetical protein|nr:hypothetical protein [Cyclobacteriaceae bacterium]